MVDVIYEDNHILVCIKPQNIPSQLDESGDLDMLTMVKNYIKEKYNKPGNVYAGLVHRLDRPTGGVMVFAKTTKSAQRLSEQIKNKQFSKKYLTICTGITQKQNDRLINYLKKDEKLNKVSIVKKHIVGAKLAELEYNLVSTYQNKLSLFEINLFTGRSHQIRVQMSGINLPIFGDSKYGTVKNQNLALWSYKLEFTHPTLKQKMNFTVYPPLKNSPWNYFEKEIKLLK